MSIYVTHRSCTTLDFGQPPLIRLLVLVIQRLNLLLLFALRQLVGIRDLEELWRGFDEPFGLNGAYVVAVLARREYELVVDKPLWRAVEERRRWMNVDRRALDKRLISFLRILLRRVPEEARANGASNTVIIFARRQDVMLVAERRDVSDGSPPIKHEPTDP
jgi:hypothetical protein